MVIPNYLREYARSRILRVGLITKGAGGGMIQRGATVVLVLTTLFVALVARPSVATTPGTNGRIVFTSTRTGNEEIWTMNADGTDLRQLTRNKQPDYTAAWSPDGRRIAFVGEAKGNADLYVMNADGTGLFRLTFHKGGDWAPSWSPDGLQIVFASNRDGDVDAWVIDVPGAPGRFEPLTRNLTPGLSSTSEWAPDWSPALVDGSSKIVFMSGAQNGSNYDQYAVERSASGAFSAPRALLVSPESEYGAAWSPSATQLAVPRLLAAENTWRLFTFDADGSNVQPLVKSSNGYHVRAYYPTYSPDGTQMVMERRSSYPSGNPEVFVGTFDGPSSFGTLVNITNNAATDYQPDWQTLP